MGKPKVSVFCLAFNQKHYIRQCLDGMLMQQTDFPFEILINDDASTDGTTEIIRDYQKQHPGAIKLVTHKENQYSQGKRGFIIRYLLPKARGDFFAVCEGDDYWTDPEKLQRQVDFLEKNPDYALCFHPVKVVFEDKSKPDYEFPEEKAAAKFTLEALLKENFIQTNSVMYRRQKYTGMQTDMTPMDWYLHVYHARFGKIGFINKLMSVYRRHPDGVWWNSDGNIDEIWKRHGFKHFALYVAFYHLFSGDENYQAIIFNLMAKLLHELVRVDREQGTNLFGEISSVYPEHLGRLISFQYQALRTQNEQVKHLRQNVADERRLKEDAVKVLEEIYASASWRVTEPLRNVNKLRKPPK